ncbi:MAG: TetM/TetW/TetO/TetS family tetracycline resistance ribosomal protection protein [Eubacterium sp.]|nr:TetM/TetW/TetO/TetS family tetracycline resistance ribosomal protection protein [Eubacterium sp.]
MQTGHFSIGILAHVDAGKTTLAEGLFYLAKKTRHLGRVDHKDAFFDYYGMERSRGITIFSKTAQLPLGAHTITLLDTPGHVDFSAEMERSLSVMDYAILIISGTDGVQSHTRTLFELLDRYAVPTFVFVNKMDRPETDRDDLMRRLKDAFGDICVDFTGYQEDDGAFAEELAMLDESWMESYLAGEPLTNEILSKLIQHRTVMPCFFGSALHMDGVSEFYDALGRLTQAPDFAHDFRAQVFKIARDDKGARLVQAKITGGTLSARQEVYLSSGESAKVSQIRLYDGARYETIGEAGAGMIVALTGLDAVMAGDILTGAADQQSGKPDEMPSDDIPSDRRQAGSVYQPVLKPVLSYTIVPPEGEDPKLFYQKLAELSQEEPELAVSWNERAQEINARLMGEVQIEVLKQQILDRFGVSVAFAQGSVIYQETIRKPVIGIGHFEPLRHYAEVHVLIEPGEPGSGVIYENRCPDELLDRSWQKTALKHLMEKEHIGVLTGSLLTDVKISLIAGRAHKKHSEGADFREAAWRAVRQGLMQAENVLLEPVFSFTLELPSGQVGRAMTDVRNMGGTTEDPQIGTEEAVLAGRAPVALMQDYGREVQAYTGGLGKLSLRFAGYQSCQNADKVIEEIAYDPDADLENPSSSLFCEKGAALYVPWDEVPEKCRVESGVEIADAKDDETDADTGAGRKTGADSDETTGKKPGADPGGAAGKDGLTSGRASGAVSAFSEEDKELQAIFERTYGGREETGKKGRWSSEPKALASGSLVQPQSNGKYQKKEKPPGEVFLLVDGYNIIHAWDELKELAKENLDSSRDALMDILSEYHGSRQGHLIVVFDAYKVKGGQEHVYRYHNIDVVYTKEAETADAYIERVTRRIGKNNDVTVATSDGLEQIIIWGHGARRMSASELKAEVEQAKIEVRAFLAQRNSAKTRLFDHLSKEDAQAMERIRLGLDEKK